MIYIFDCPGLDHHGERRFEKFFHGVPKGNPVTQTECPQDGCGAVAKRRWDEEMKSQAVTGLTPISHATTVKGSIAHDLKFAFGDLKENPDGTVDRNHTPFRDSGELDRFLGGKNNLGPRVVDDNGNPLRDSKGNYVHKGAKLIKYGKNDAPSKTDARRFKPRYRGVEWGDKGVRDFGDTNSRTLRD